MTEFNRANSRTIRCECGTPFCLAEGPGCPCFDDILEDEFWDAINEEPQDTEEPLETITVRICDSDCEHWQERNDATAVHGKCKVSGRFVIDHDSVCGCDTGLGGVEIMNIKCFSDLEDWMQGVVKQVKAATGTEDAVCLSLKKEN